MGFVSRVRCVACGAEVDAPASSGTCPVCADPFSVLEVEFDLLRVGASLTRAALAERTPFHWRYHELLPIEPDEGAFAWPVGGTPIIEAPRLAAHLGVRRVRLKDDGRNPTASFKDRASSVGVLHALQHGATRIACASTGNAASSLAGCAALAGIPATIFVPARAPEGKVAQLLMYGAEVRRVRGTYAQAYDLCSDECARHGWYSRNCAINPYLVEGKKTCGLEIAERTASDLPAWVAVSVGDGCTIAGIAKGLWEMRELGLIDGLPRILGVQAEGAAPVARAFETGAMSSGEFPGTIADSIDVPLPRNWRKAVRWVAALEGAFVTVSDDEIGAAMRSTGALAGVFAEPAAAAGVAGVGRAVAERILPSDADVLVVVTGSGLKDVRTALRFAGAPIDVDPPCRSEVVREDRRHAGE